MNNTRWRLTLGYIIIFSITVIFGGVGIYLTILNNLTNALDTTLRDASSLAIGNIEDPPAKPEFSPDLKASGDLAIELLTTTGKRLGLVGDLSTLPSKVEMGFSSSQNRRWYTIVGEKNVILRVSRSVESIGKLLQTLASVLFLAVILMIGVACLAGYWLADRALRPVDAVARTAALIAVRGSYFDRVPEAQGNDEMARLTQTVNQMLGRLAQTIELEKAFARAAAHELRTPLTVLKARLELSLAKPRDAISDQKSFISIQARVEDLVLLTEQLEALAQTEAPKHLELLDLEVLLLQLQPEIEELLGAKKLTLHLEPMLVKAEKIGLQQVILNLVSNASKYSSGGQILIQTIQNRLEVFDNGSGPDPKTWTRLERPFERGLGTQKIVGSGLGLSLVLALCKRWDASLEPHWDNIGFTVIIKFPKL